MATILLFSGQPYYGPGGQAFVPAGQMGAAQGGPVGVANGYYYFKTKNLLVVFYL